MFDVETKEQLDAEAQERFEEWCIEEQDQLEIAGPRFRPIYPDDEIPF